MPATKEGPVTLDDEIFGNPERWREAVDRLAPEPDYDNFDAVVWARRSVAEWVSGQLDLIPAFLDPRLRHAGKAVLRQIPAIKGLPEGWEQRHRQVQVEFDPALAECYEPPSKEDANAEQLVIQRRSFVMAINLMRLDWADWSDRSKCVDAPADKFHITVDTKQKPPVDLLSLAKATAREYCSKCPVTEECYKFGKKNSKTKNGHAVYGGRLFKVSKIKGKNNRIMEEINLL